MGEFAVTSAFSTLAAQDLDPKSQVPVREARLAGPSQSFSGQQNGDMECAGMGLAILPVAALFLLRSFRDEGC